MPKSIPARHVKLVKHLAHLFQSRRTLWQMLSDVFKGRYRMSLVTTGGIVFCLIYVVVPFDLLPDYIPVVGWIDDGLVLYLLLKRLGAETQRYNRHKAMGRRR
ncbi:MAG: hypothetical protein BGO69_05835 [Bacteroidetes bacterium 46-16]|nr:MAG: hypothetical protein BGO69_05835 [Bacteroidetes bacterium 46-16]